MRQDPIIELTIKNKSGLHLTQMVVDKVSFNPESTDFNTVFSVFNQLSTHFTNHTLLMNRRNFVATVPVLAAGLTGFSPLLAGSLANPTSKEALMAGFHTFFDEHRSAVSSSERAIIDQLCTPVSRPDFVAGKLTFKVKSGETASLFHHKGELRIAFA
ncbi:MAG: hypothetical protein ACI81P_001123 [Neolewinella sp.]|jgi:hypothetical protein